MKKRILFVCHGNICRSPMAEFVMKQLVAEAGLAEEFEIASVATSTEEIGNDLYPPVRRLLAAKRIPFGHRAARQIARADYEYYDLIIAMDNNNLCNLRRVIGEDDKRKVSLLMQATGSTCDVADPWYTGDFETTYRDVLAGCTALLQHLMR